MNKKHNSKCCHLLMQVTAVVYALFIVAPIVCGVCVSGSCFIMLYPVGEERAGCFTFVIFWMSCHCYRFLPGYSKTLT